jgi:site-specific recombinase XerD
MKKFDRPILGFLSRDEMQAILEAPDARTWAGERDQAPFSLMYNTGARVSEVIGLRVGNVVIDGRRSRICMARGARSGACPSGVRRPNCSAAGGAG